MGWFNKYLGGVGLERRGEKKYLLGAKEHSRFDFGLSIGCLMRLQRSTDYHDANHTVGGIGGLWRTLPEPITSTTEAPSDILNRPPLWDFPMPAKTTQHSAADALKWMEDLSLRGKRVVFRGQSRIHPDIFPSLLRATVSEDERRAWWGVLRRFISNRDGLTGYRIRSPHDAIAVVQHYLVKSPVIDVTGTPRIALYFALMNASPEPTRVVYAIDVDAVLAAGNVVTDHAFLALPFHDGGRGHRWLRQDGFTIGAADWTTLDRARSLDFARLPGLKSFSFRMEAGEEVLVSKLGDLETIEGDPLAAKVREVFEDIAHHLGCLEMVQRLMPARGTIDGHGLLLAEIDDLIDRARKLPLLPDDICQIERFREAAIKHYWDTSWDCGFESWKAKIAAAGK